MRPVFVREAATADAPAMADLLNRIIRTGGTTAYVTPFDAEGIHAEFIAPRYPIGCFVALDRDILVGFQSVQWSDPDWVGAHPLPADWAFIATFVDGGHRRSGAGRALFGKTVRAAREAGVRSIDATIRVENTLGLRFYDGMGFQTYRTGPDTVSKRFDCL